MSFIAYASGHTAAAQSLVARLNDVIVFPLITLLTAIALMIFLWGVFQYIVNSGDAAARETGRQHMIWGIVGLLIMISAFSILEIAAGTFGVFVP